MRHGMSPLDAGMDVLKRIVRNYNGDMAKLRFMDMTYYILRKDGAYAGVSLWEGYGPDATASYRGARRQTPIRKDGGVDEGGLAGISAIPEDSRAVHGSIEVGSL